jgi:predicted nucleic acid-binding protein
MLVDSDVIIWYMRGNIIARNILDNLDNLTISAITYMELVQGMRNKAELTALETTLINWRATVLPLNENISEIAITLMKQFFLSHSLMLGDALIAATALNSGLPLLTANNKHYQMINGLELQIFRPN